jgi:hypothetical protein
MDATLETSDNSKPEPTFAQMDKGADDATTKNKDDGTLLNIHYCSAQLI